jgi:hypothetical protein
MKANELRLNNLLFYGDEVLKVASIHNDNTIRFEKDNSTIGCFSTKLLSIKSIPLTEEWLLKFGFERRKGMYYASATYHKEILKTDFYLRRAGGYENWFWGISSGDDFDTIHFIDVEFNDAIRYSYVHQLQNLYFALTNEELTIK